MERIKEKCGLEMVLKEEQGLIIQHLLNGSDVFELLPTGFGKSQNEASAREIATCKHNVGGQKEDFMQSNFQMNISLPWIDAAFTQHLKLYLNIYFFPTTYHLLNGSDVFELLPTGFGKSLTYTLLPLILDEVGFPPKVLQI
jgi:hypothetical protein